MPYRVELSDRALRDLEFLYVGKKATESDAAFRWFNRLEQAVLSLQTHPHRCPIAPESRKSKRKLRHLLYGRKPNVYRVIYEVDEGRRAIWILSIRHGAQRELGPSALD